MIYMEQRSGIETPCRDNALNDSPPFGLAQETKKEKALLLPGCLEIRQLLRHLKSHTVLATAVLSNRESTLLAELQGGMLAHRRTHAHGHTNRQIKKKRR